jgi:hypothetical protein
MWTDAVHVCPFACLLHTLPVSSNCLTVWYMALDGATQSEDSRLLSLHSNESQEPPEK